jgi:hypothetical protein
MHDLFCSIIFIWKFTIKWIFASLYLKRALLCMSVFMKSTPDFYLFLPKTGMYPTNFCTAPQYHDMKIHITLSVSLKLDIHAKLTSAFLWFLVANEPKTRQVNDSCPTVQEIRWTNWYQSVLAVEYACFLSWKHYNVKLPWCSTELETRKCVLHLLSPYSFSQYSPFMNWLITEHGVVACTA